ncbi:MAG: hypothetical protein JWQ97_2329 [Phenylobacterium sp.]|nr:hypothetical protein [Phenylobacterium sp.]
MSAGRASGDLAARFGIHTAGRLRRARLRSAAIMTPLDRTVPAAPYAGTAFPQLQLRRLPARLRAVDPQVAAALSVIAVFTLLRLVAAAGVGLGVDEAYALGISRRLALSYYDHPPLHQWIVHLFGGVLGYGRAARLPFILLFAGSSWLLFDFARHLYGARAGLWSVLVLNLSGFFSVVAGGWVLPDGPLIFCLLAAASRLARIIFPAPVETGRDGSTAAWALAGIWIGLAGLSKYQAVLSAAGLVVFLAASRPGRAHLKRPGPYVAALIAAAIVSPVFLWNAQHHWVSFLFQGGRGLPGHGLRPGGAVVAFLGQAAVMLPWVMALLVAALWRPGPAGWGSRRRWFCLALGGPAILLFILTPIWGQPTLPHWAMPGWLFTLPLAGDLLAREAAVKRWPRTWAALSLCAFLALWSFVVVEAATGWLGRAWPSVFVNGDPTVETVEWSGARALERSAVMADPSLFLVAAKWNEAGRLVEGFGVRRPIVVASSDPRGFAYDGPAGALVGRDALVVVRPIDAEVTVDRLRHCFASLQPVGAVQFGRFGSPEVRLETFLGRRLSARCGRLGTLSR